MIISSYNDKIKREISATWRMEFYAMFGSGYQLEHFA